MFGTSCLPGPVQMLYTFSSNHSKSLTTLAMISGPYGCRFIEEEAEAHRGRGLG